MPHPTGGKAPKDASKYRNHLPEVQENESAGGSTQRNNPHAAQAPEIDPASAASGLTLPRGGAVACGRSLVWYAFSKPLITSHSFSIALQRTVISGGTGSTRGIGCAREDISLLRILSSWKQAAAPGCIPGTRSAIKKAELDMRLRPPAPLCHGRRNGRRAEGELGSRA